jgi:hypothetical protein
MGNAGQIWGQIRLHDEDALVLLSRSGQVSRGILKLLLRWHTRVHNEVVVLRLLLREGHVRVLGGDVVKPLPHGGYIVLDDEDALVLLRRGIWVNGEILNLLLGAHRSPRR